MIYSIESFVQSDARVEIDGKYVIARPINNRYRNYFERLKDAWAVFTGSAEAVSFYKQ